MAVIASKLKAIRAGHTEEEERLEFNNAILEIGNVLPSYFQNIAGVWQHSMAEIIGEAFNAPFDLAHHFSVPYASMLHPIVQVKELQQERATAKAKRPAQRRSVPVQPTGLNAKNDHVVHHIEIALMCPEDYKMNEKENKLVYQHYFDAPRNKGTGIMKLVISGLAIQAHENVNIALDSLGDACRDTFVALFGLYVERYGTSDMRKNFKISIDGILDACGKQRSNGAFTPEARAEVIKHIKTLSQTSINFSMPTMKPVKQGRKVIWEDTEIKVAGPIIVYGGSIGEYSRITGKEYWEFHDVTFGQWAGFIDGNVQTKLLPQQVLAYSPKHEPYHKKLGHYITTLFRNNASRINAQHSKGIMPHGITMSVLFENALITPPRERGKLKDDIDKALKHLKQDGVIGDYWYEAKNDPRSLEIAEKRIGRWFDTYIGLYINFSAPKDTIGHYKSIAKKEK